MIRNLEKLKDYMVLENSADGGQGEIYNRISVRLLFSIVINLSTVNHNLPESRDFTILLRSNGNQALICLRHDQQAL